MIQDLPFWISILFIATTVLSILLFHFSNDRPTKITSLILIWSLIQSLIAYSGFYLNAEAFPPRFAYVMLPPIIFILYSVTNEREWIFKRRNTQLSSFIHIVRLPVEIILLQLFIHKMVPQVMTFEGRNFDILMGITAPIIGLLYYKKIIGHKTLLGWNIIGLFLICFILLNGILTAELPFQQFAFDQPNKAPTYFPFVLLPATIVPLVIWTHISDILILLKNKEYQ